MEVLKAACQEAIELGPEARQFYDQRMFSGRISPATGKEVPSHGASVQAESHPHVPKGQAGFAKQNGMFSAAVAGIAGVYAANEAHAKGASFGEIAKAGANAAVNTIPGVAPGRHGKGAETTTQVGISAAAWGVGAAAVATGSAALGGAAVAVGTIGDMAVRDAVRAFGVDVEKSEMRKVIENRAAIPTKVVLNNQAYMRQQNNILADAGLVAFQHEGKTLDPAALLRDPKTQQTYMDGLKQAMSKEQNAATREKLTHMVEAATKFVEIEGRRIAKLEPYATQIQQAFAEKLQIDKAQHLAAQFKQNNPNTPTLAQGEPLPQKQTPVQQAQTQERGGRA